MVVKLKISTATKMMVTMKVRGICAPFDSGESLTSAIYL